VLGIPGLTAWAGLRTIARPRPGDVVLVSTAAGAVGSMACQLARLAGADVVGVAGSADKCAIAVADYGCRTCIDYHATDFADALAAACPDGVDVYFDNVGGRVLEAALGRLRRHARVVLCGMIDQYNRDVRPPGPNLGPVIAARATLTGLVVYDHLDRYAEMVIELAPLIAQGQLRWREDVSIGIGMAAEAFCGMMRGANTGKALVQVAADGWRC
jgi:NADPH-dependent curcumin reductase CurA